MTLVGLYAVDLRLIDIDMAVRGYLTIVVTQASSRTKANDVVWDSTFAEGFVKGKKVTMQLCKMTRGSFMPLLCSGGSRWAPQQQGIAVLCLPCQDYVCAFAQNKTNLHYNMQVVSSTKKVSDGLLEWNETLKL